MNRSMLSVPRRGRRVLWCLLLAAGVLVALAGCGNKGDLVRPEATPASGG